MVYENPDAETLAIVKEPGRDMSFKRMDLNG